MLLLNHPGPFNIFFEFKKCFIGIAKLYICIVLVIIRNTSHCIPIHFKSRFIIIKQYKYINLQVMSVLNGMVLNHLRQLLHSVYYCFFYFIKNDNKSFQFKAV